MLSKIKNYLSVIGAFSVVLLLSTLLFLLRRSRSDGCGSSGADGRDFDVEGGIDRASERAKGIEGHLNRAEEILRNAINRNKKGEGEV